MSWFKRFLSIDDLWSVIGFIAFVVIIRSTNASWGLAGAAALAGGMLAIFWLASSGVRARNSDRFPNARVAIWAVVAAASLLLYTSAH